MRRWLWLTGLQLGMLLPLASTSAAYLDVIPPKAEVTQTGINSAGAKFIVITVSDDLIGLESVIVTGAGNCVVEVAPYHTGSPSTQVTATKLNNDAPAAVGLLISDVAGNITARSSDITPPTAVFTKLRDVNNVVTGIKIALSDGGAGLAFCRVFDLVNCTLRNPEALGFDVGTAGPVEIFLDKVDLTKPASYRFRLMDAAVNFWPGPIVYSN